MYILFLFLFHKKINFQKDKTFMTIWLIDNEVWVSKWFINKLAIAVWLKWDVSKSINRIDWLCLLTLIMIYTNIFVLMWCWNWWILLHLCSDKRRHVWVMQSFLHGILYHPIRRNHIPNYIMRIKPTSYILCRHIFHLSSSLWWNYVLGAMGPVDPQDPSLDVIVSSACGEVISLKSIINQHQI